MTPPDLDPDALAVAAKKTGLRPDQIARAVEEYRSATYEQHAEPEWRATWHMHGPTEAMHQYTADGTKVALQVNCFKGRSAAWDEERVYTFNGHPYETFGEARSAELRESARPKPYSVEPAK